MGMTRGLISLVLIAEAWMLSACAAAGHPAARIPTVPAAGIGAIDVLPVAAPPALARLGVGTGRALRVAGFEDWPLSPMYPMGGNVVVGLPAPGVPYGSGRRLAGYGVVALSDGRLARLPAPRPGWSVAEPGAVLAAAGGRVMWLESQQQAGGYRWAVYSAPGSGSAPRLLAQSGGPVSLFGVPMVIGAEGNAACWAGSADSRRWTVVRRPVTGQGLRVTGAVDDVVTSCQPDGDDTLVMTFGNVFDLRPDGTVRTLLKGGYNLAALGNQIAFYSENTNTNAESWTLSVARLTGQGVTAARTVGPHGVSQFAWLDGQHLAVVTGPAPGDPRPLLLVNARNGLSSVIAAPRSGIIWMAVSDGQLLYAWERPPAGPGQVLEIDDFTLPHHS